MVLDKDWRPENWEQMRRRLAATPAVWSPSSPSLGLTEQIVEATASKILECLAEMTAETPVDLVKEAVAAAVKGIENGEA